MNAVLKTRVLPDVQSRPDTRNLPIEAAGIQGLRAHATVPAHGRPVPTLATWSLSVGVPAAARGTHMSRFVELVEAERTPLTPASLRALLERMLAKLGAASGAIEVAYPLLLPKRAPASGALSHLDYGVRWCIEAAADGSRLQRLTVTVPVTTLCPCSKEISDHGAHNQRSLVTVSVELAKDIEPEILIAAAEASASCELYGLLKREDEKAVTERAYENPKFAEDLVRDVALELARDPRVARYEVLAENLESIHNHSAFARLRGDGPLHAGT
jgi:GTP cyclohydrolase FolE2